MMSRRVSFARRTLQAALLVICAAHAAMLHAQAVRRNAVRLVTHETPLGKRRGPERLRVRIEIVEE